jgi:hypothetical protein
MTTAELRALMKQAAEEDKVVASLESQFAAHKFSTHRSNGVIVARPDALAVQRAAKTKENLQVLAVVALAAVAGVFHFGIGGQALFGWAIILMGICLYFLPATTAVNRRNPNALAIFVMNLLLGWTLIGWVMALVWAYTGKPVQS